MLAADDIHKRTRNFKLIYGCEAYFVDDMVPCSTVSRMSR